MEGKDGEILVIMKVNKKYLAKCYSFICFSKG